MCDMARREELSQFVEWLCDLYVRGWLVESEDYKKVRKTPRKSTTVHRIGPAKGIIEDDEGKRKAS